MEVEGECPVCGESFSFEIDDPDAGTGGVMPPKSTWFEPKLRDGLLVHLI